MKNLDWKANGELVGVMPTGEHQKRDGVPMVVVVAKLHNEYVASTYFSGDTSWCQGYYSRTLSGAVEKACELAQRYQ